MNPWVRTAVAVLAFLSALALAAPAQAAYQFVSKWGGQGVGNGQFSVPRGVAVDSAGNVYVADSGNNRIQKFGPDGTYITQWGGTGTAAGQFQGPEGIAVSPAGNVYVADRNNNRVQRFTSTGGSATVIGGGPGASGGQFNHPNGVALDSAGNLYVADYDNRRVQKLDSTPSFDRLWGWDVVTGGSTTFEICTVDTACKLGAPGTNDGQFTLPQDVAVDSGSSVYVADSSSGGPIQKFDSNGNFIARFGPSPGAGDGQFNQPRGIDVSQTSGNYFVADRNNSRVQRFTSAGAFVEKFGSFGSGNGQFLAPYDVALAPSGDLYVTDESGNHVQRFSEPAAQLPPPPPPGGLPGPVYGRLVNAARVRGRVFLQLPAGAQAAGSARASQKGRPFVPLTAARQIPVGSVLDTRRGTVRLVSARNTAGATQTGDFAAGLFQVLQSRRRSARGLTDLVLKGGSFARRVCGSAGRAQASALRRRRVRRLRSNARGRFRTRGRHSAATVRGTVWTTTDRCDGTLTTVSRGSVVVRDLRRRKNIVVRAGKRTKGGGRGSYLARARR